MTRNLKLEKHNVYANACIAINETKDKAFTIDRITAVDLRGSKCIQTMTDDFGMVVYNENMHGFYVSWKEYETLQKELNIAEEEYEAFLDDFTADLVDTVINYINKK